MKPSRSSNSRPLTPGKLRLPRVIPPGSVVVLAHADAMTPLWRGGAGRAFRIGYYSRQDGLKCIWLVNQRGEYEQTTNRATLLRHFRIRYLTTEEDFYGDHRPPLAPLPDAAMHALIA